MSKDYYKVLGVDKSASAEEIKKAYRKLAHQHHPDKNGGDESKFKEINEAFQVLGNDEKRKRYDQYGADFDAQGGFGGNANWDDFMRASRGQGGFEGFNVNFGGVDLSDLFGDMFGMGGGRRTHAEHRRGRDIAIDVELTLADVLNDVTKTMRLRKKSACDVCGGNGAEPGSSLKSCTTCNGSGRVEEMQRTILGMMRSATTCSACNGYGKIPDKKCKHCHGDGVVQKESEIKVKIPAGISDGESIRLTGYGEAIAHGTAGDLYVRVHVKHDAHFERDGADLHTAQAINMAQAALGETLELKTVTGTVKVSVPEGTQPGQVIRIKGHGLPHLGRPGIHGDLYVKMIVDVPKKLNKKAKKLLEDLKGEL